MRDKERSELLDQYKLLNDEAETSASYGRKLESKISELHIETTTKDQELKAAELRLTHMEQDLMEMTLSNENYRSQVFRLNRA